MFIRYTKIIKIVKSLPAFTALRVFFKHFWQTLSRGNPIFAVKFKNC